MIDRRIVGILHITGDIGGTIIKYSSTGVGTSGGMWVFGRLQMI